MNLTWEVVLTAHITLQLYRTQEQNGLTLFLSDFQLQKHSKVRRYVCANAHHLISWRFIRLSMAKLQIKYFYVRQVFTI